MKIDELKKLALILIIFGFAYFLPVQNPKFFNAIAEGLHLVRWYAREHVILCLIPAFFIAGVISVFFSQAAIIKYLGAQAKKWLAYLIASVSGTILAVCSCTVLPLFASIYKRGAGLGPAIAFLYSGPAINILAIILTARILGLEIGVARAIGAILFSIIIGLLMEVIYRKEKKVELQGEFLNPSNDDSRPLWQTLIHFFILVLILIFVNWSKPIQNSGLWYLIFSYKWLFTGILGIFLALYLIIILKIKRNWVIGSVLIVITVALIVPYHPVITFTTALGLLVLMLGFSPNEPQEWLNATWDFAKQILPLLLGGVLVAGFLLGGPEGGQGVIPRHWVTSLVGGNSLFSNFFASIFGAFMYFATLTEIPILQGLLANGMSKGPALALLLAGPALSLPNMLVIRSVIGTQKTVVYVSLVVIIATICGYIFGLMV